MSFCIFLFFVGFCFIVILFFDEFDTNKQQIIRNKKKTKLHSFDWFKFGAYYVYFFYDNMVWVLTKGVTEWDGYWDMDTMVGTHIVFATIVDVAFSTAHFFLIPVLRNKNDKKLFDMAFFQM